MRAHYDGERIEHLHRHVLVMDHKLDLLLAHAEGAEQATIDELTAKLKASNDAKEAALKEAENPQP